MGLQDTWDQEEEDAKDISRDLKEGSQASAMDKMIDYRKKYGESFSEREKRKEQEGYDNERRI